MKRGNLDTETDTHTERMPGEHGGRDRGDASTSPEHQGLPANYEKRRERHATDSPSQPQRKQPCQRLDLGLPATRTVRQQISVVQAIRCVALCCNVPSKLLRHRPAGLLSNPERAALVTTLPASAALVLLLLRPYSSFEGQLETHLLQEPASEPPLNFGISPTAEYLIVL